MTWDTAKKYFNIAVVGSAEQLQKFEMWYKYSNYQATGIGGPGNTSGTYPIPELNFHSLRNSINSSLGLSFKHKKDGKTMESGDYTELQTKTAELYRAGIDKIQAGNHSIDNAAAEREMIRQTSTMTVTQMIIWTTDIPKAPVV